MIKYKYKIKRADKLKGDNKYEKNQLQDPT